jgi:hypothetical protein
MKLYMLRSFTFAGFLILFLLERFTVDTYLLAFISTWIFEPFIKEIFKIKS